MASRGRIVNWKPRRDAARVVVEDGDPEPLQREVAVRLAAGVQKIEMTDNRDGTWSVESLRFVREES